MLLVKLKRSKGIIVQDCDIYIGRSMNMGGWKLPQSKYANQFTIKNSGSVDNGFCPMNKNNFVKML